MEVFEQQQKIHCLDLGLSKTYIGDLLNSLFSRPKPPAVVPRSEPDSDYLAPRIIPASEPIQPHYDEVPDGPRSRSASPDTRVSSDDQSDRRLPSDASPGDRNNNKLYKTEATIRLSGRDNDITTSL